MHATVSESSVTKLYAHARARARAHALAHVNVWVCAHAQAAWADRDVRQRVQDGEIKDMAFQMQQAQLFTALATTRIKQLNGELEPIRDARDEAHATLARCASRICAALLRAPMHGHAWPGLATPMPAPMRSLHKGCARSTFQHACCHACIHGWLAGCRMEGVTGRQLERQAQVVEDKKTYATKLDIAMKEVVDVSDTWALQSAWAAGRCT